jgi:hypothetical protein
MEVQECHVVTDSRRHVTFLRLLQKHRPISADASVKIIIGRYATKETANTNFCFRRQFCVEFVLKDLNFGYLPLLL